MADVNANIDININSSGAIDQLKSLQRQISAFHTSIAKSSETAALAQKNLQRNLLSSINSIGAFSAEMRTIKTSAESFTSSLEKNEFSMRQYFRYAGGATKTFGKLFATEFNTIGKVAEERVKKLQTQYIKMGRDVNGQMRAMAIMPTSLDMNDYGTKVQIAAQKQALFNQLMKQGSTNLLNFGKNTQWAGRQLMVGFSLPLMAIGSTATKTFMDMEAQAIKFKKVYGDMLTPKAETQAALEQVQELAKEFTKYGVAVSQTVGLAADAAAAGFKGADLLAQTTQATRLSILGQIDQNQALQTTIALQNAFNISSQELADTTNFLNAVENQTVTSLDDLTVAVPKVAPVIQQLGGDVKDLAFFLTAMKEGGVNASEGANALKSGLAALINPTTKAREMLRGMGIDIAGIVSDNKGDLKGTVIGFAQALDKLAPLTRARAIEQMFGKFQFARLSTLFQNVTKDGTQAARVLELAGTSVEDLAALSEQELGVTANSAMLKFKKAVEDIKAALIPIGQSFLQAVTPVIDFVGNILEKFANLSEGTKKVITILTVGLLGLGPVLLMTFGLIANGVANSIKGFMNLRNIYERITGQTKILGEQTQYMTEEQLMAEAVAHSLDQTHASLTQTFTAEAAAVNELIVAYTAAARAAQQFAVTNPGAMLSPKKGKFASGGIISGAGTGTSDSIPIMASNGEAIIPADSVKKYPSLVAGLIAKNIPGYAQGTLNVSGRAVQMNFRNQQDPSKIQSIIDKVMSGAAGLANAEEVISETLLRLSEDTNASTSRFVKELDTVATALEKKQISEKIVGERDYSASGAGVKSVPVQLQGSRGAAGLEEYKRAEVAAKASYDAYEKMGVSGQELALGLQVDRAHIVEVTQAEKRYAEAWDTRLFIAQSRAENEMSMLLTNEKNQKAYVSVLQNSGESEEMKRSILNKITKDLALTEDELQAQVRILQTMQKDTVLMKTTTPKFARAAIGTIASGQARAAMGPATLAGVGSRTAEEIAMGQQALNVRQFRGTTSFVRKLEQTGESAVDRLLIAMKKRAKIKSPSEETDKIGIDLMRGLDQGMQRGMGSVESTGADATGAAIGGMRKGSRRASSGIITTGPGTPYSSIAAGLPANTDALAKHSKKIQESSARLSRMNGALMSGMFALTSLSGVAQMAGGSIGQLSNVIFNLTAPLLALSSILQMFTGEKILSLITKFKVGFGAAGLALAAGITIIKLTNAARERERMAIEGLADAATLTKEKLAFLADQFNTIPNKLPATLATVTSVQATDKNRAQIETLKDSKDFQKQFGKDIEALKSATKGQALIAFRSLSASMQGQGFSDQSIQNFITALGESAAKSDVVLKFKKIDVTTAEGQSGVKKDVEDIISLYQKEFKDGVARRPIVTPGLRGAVGFGSKSTLNKEQATQLKTATAELGNIFLGLGGQVRNGSISVTNFNDAMSKLIPTLDTLKGAGGVRLLQSILMSNNTVVGNASKAVTDYSAKLIILRATLIGVGLAQKNYNDLASKDPAVRAAAIAAIEKMIALKEKEVVATNAVNEADLSGTGKKNPIKEKIKDIENQTKAFKTLRLAQIDQKTATDLSNDSEIAALVVANSKGKSLKNIIGLINQYKKALKEQTSVNYQYADSVTKQTTNLNKLKAYADLRDQLIDTRAAVAMRAYNAELSKQEALLQGVNDQIQSVTANQIAPIEARIKANNYALDKIALQEDAVNEKYNAQIDALNKVAAINQDIANIQQQRLSIADALSRGDISAAAQLTQDARAQQAATAVSQTEAGLTAAKDAQIAALGRAALEKQNKDLQMQISDIERTQLDTLNQQKATIELSIDAVNRQITALNTSVEQEKAKAVYAGKTREEIDLAIKMISLGMDANENYSNILGNSALNAEQMAAGLWNAVAAQKELVSVKAMTIGDITAGVKSGAITPSNMTTAQKKVVSTAVSSVNTKIKTLQNSLLGKNLGGIIPSYFANGGRAVGADTIPAMLTPGEFIVNRNATKAHRPLLESINASSYPSMLGSRSGSGVAVSTVATSVNNSSSSVYNYSLGFNINGSNSNPDEIARAVITQIKQIDAQRIRGQRS